MRSDWTDFAIALPQIVHIVFAFAFGACAGSFIHLVAWRMPEGLSVISPPSRCPVCGYRLPWYDNLPILGWLRLRGRCGACGVRIPARYVLSEIAMGLLFAGVYLVLFTPTRHGFWYPVGNGWWSAQGLLATIPALAVVLWAIGSLVAMMLCDARSYLIPIAIPTWASIIAFVGWPLAALVSADLSPSLGHPFPMLMPGWSVSLACTGALAGLAIGQVLLATGVLPTSFADYDDYLEKEGDTFADYPHARREMLKEVAFLVPALLLAGVGLLLARAFPAPADLPLVLHAFFACATGFVVGGAIVWVVRILASVLLDTEALGLGDVHLLAAAGAALGWRAAVVGFLAAPFIGLGWWTINLVRHAPMRMPFGPALAIGSITAYLMRPALDRGVRGGMEAMAHLAGAARNAPGATLALSALCAVAAVGLAFPVRGGRGWATAASILAMVGAVVTWIFASPSLPIPGAIIGGVIVGACIAAGVVARPHLEEESGPRTVLARVLRLLAFAVVLIGAFLLVAGPGSQGAASENAESGAASPLHAPSGTVQ